MNSIRLIFLFVALTLGAQASDLTASLPHQLRSRYFDFRYQRAEWDASSFARFADSFVELVNREFFPAHFNYPIRVLVLPDRAAFQAFLIEKLDVPNPPNFGIYIPGKKLFATFETSGLGTFAHEIMHPLVERNLPDRPAWAMEGVPSFFEKFYGFYERSALRAQWGYQNPWRIHALGGRLLNLDLASLVSETDPPRVRDTSEDRLVSMFLWKHGKLPRFLRLVASRARNGHPTYFEAAMERPLHDILPLWRDYLDEIIYNRPDILRLPASQVLATRDDFETFMRDQRLPVTLADVPPKPARTPTPAPPAP